MKREHKTQSPISKNDAVSYLSELLLETSGENYEEKKPMSEYNLDSIDYMHIATGIEYKFGFHISDERLQAIKERFTAGRLADYIYLRAKRKKTLKDY